MTYLKKHIKRRIYFVLVLIVLVFCIDYFNVFYERGTDDFKNEALKIEYSYHRTNVFQDVPTTKKFKITNNQNGKVGVFEYVDIVGFLDTDFIIDSLFETSDGEIVNVLQIGHEIFINLETVEDISDEYYRSQYINNASHLIKIIDDKFIRDYEETPILGYNGSFRNGVSYHKGDIFRELDILIDSTVQNKIGVILKFDKELKVLSIKNDTLFATNIGEWQTQNIIVKKFKGNKVQSYISHSSLSQIEYLMRKQIGEIYQPLRKIDANDLDLLGELIYDIHLISQVNLVSDKKLKKNHSVNIDEVLSSSQLEIIDLESRKNE